MSTRSHHSVWKAAALGGGFGLVLSLVDIALLSALGVEMAVAGRSAVWLVFAFFAGTYSAFGAACGALLAVRGQLKQERERILEAHRALQETKDQLLQAEKLAGLGRMAAGVAHEVKNPLAVIRSSAELIAEEIPAESEGARACSFVIQEVDRLDAFVRRVLSFSRPLHAEAEPLPLSQLAGEVAERAGAELVGASAAVLPLDRALLTGALLNLVDNARGSGASQIHLRLGGDVEGPYLEVVDDGPGVAPAHQGRLFEPFFTTRADGHGLGLAMSARIAQAHGASLRYREGAGLGPGGRGACFHLHFQTEVSA